MTKFNEIISQEPQTEAGPMTQEFGPGIDPRPLPVEPTWTPPEPRPLPDTLLIDLNRDQEALEGPGFDFYRFESVTSSLYVVQRLIRFETF